MKNKNFFWGVIFILAAAFVLLSNLGYFEDIHITKIIIALLLVYIMLKNIPVREFFGVLLPLAVILIMYDDFRFAVSTACSCSIRQYRSYFPISEKASLSTGRTRETEW